MVLTALLPLAAVPVDAAASPAPPAATAGRTTAALAPDADVALSRRQDALDLARGRLDAAATAAEKADGFGSYEYDLDHGTLLAACKTTSARVVLKSVGDES